MSGGGGGGGGGGRINDETPCDRLQFEAQLTNPQPATVATLAPNEVLDVVLNTRQNVLVVEVHKGEQLVGGLAGPDATRLRNCIGEGHSYVAVVLAVNGGQVRVRVEHI